MENTSWEERLEALTHILTHPTTSPSLHSQLFIATKIPCYIHWDYPPLLCPDSSGFPPPLLKWAFFRFLKRASRFGLPETSWRSKCPYQIPPPLILAKGVEEARWDDEEEKRKYVRKRFSRKRFGIGSNINPFIPFVVPNILLLCLLFWKPFPIDEI